MPEELQGSMNLKTTLLYGCVFLSVAYAIEMGFLNPFSGVPHFWQNAVAMVVAGLITYQIGRRRQLHRVLYGIGSGAAASLVTSLFMHQYLFAPFHPIRLLPDMICAVVVAFLMNGLIIPAWGKRRLDRPQP
jgi:formate hydrogenlyase subunit 4